MVWTAHEGFWGSEPDGTADNDLFRSNAVRWLLASGSRVGMATGHGEDFDTSKLSAALRAWMDADEIIHLDIPGAFVAQISSAFGMHLFSMFGIPVSTSSAIARIPTSQAR